MSSSDSLSNKRVMNKYLWMANQLRHMNDVASITNWSNAMLLVKRLLLEPLPGVSTPTIKISPSAPRPLSHTLSTISNQHKSSINIPPAQISNHDARSITPPTTISFKPIKKLPLTRSLVPSPSCSPSKPTPLTTYTLSNTAVSSDTLPRQPKRRKLTTPPSVDYNAAYTDQIQQAVWSILDKHRISGRLYWEKDLLVPSWVRSQVEDQLKISPRRLSALYKTIIVETVNNFYHRHEKMPPNSNLSDY